MYGSYGSYSSTPAMEIPSRSSTYHSSASLDASCAFPSWPRRDSLTADDDDALAHRASAYISDEDLQFLPAPRAVFADLDDARSVSSYGSTTSSPQLSPILRHVTEEQIVRMRREQALRQQEYLRSVVSEKERRRQQQSKAKASSKKTARKASSASPKANKLSSMTPIAEALE